MRRRILFVLVLLFTLLLFPQRALAWGEITQVKTDYVFGEQVSFQFAISSSQAVLSGMVFFKEAGKDLAGVVPLQVSALGEDLYQLETVIDLRSVALRPFSPVEYDLEATLEDGQLIKSPTYSFIYRDNRFEWELLEAPPISIYTYGDLRALSPKILATAQAALPKIQELTPPFTLPKVSFYLYQSLEEMQAAQPLNGQEWMVGHADPDLGVVILALPAGANQEILLGQRVPHELAHIALASLVPQRGSASRAPLTLPAWLEEGLPAMVEFSPSPEYAQALENAYREQALLPLQALCEAFPRQAESATIAYAQSASFTRFLINRFGTGQMRQLLLAFSAGQDCQPGVASVYGRSLGQLERAWRSETFGENPTFSALKELAPWWLLLAAILVAPLTILIASRKRQASDFHGSGEVQ